MNQDEPRMDRVGKCFDVLNVFVLRRHMAVPMGLDLTSHEASRIALAVVAPYRQPRGVGWHRCGR